MEEIDIINGTLSLLFVLISIFLGLKLIMKYFKHKEINLLYVGITWIIMCEPWWPHSVSFLLALFTGKGLSVQMFYFLAVTFVPIGLTTWLAAITDFLNYDKKKLIILVSILSQIIFEIIFFYYLFTEPSIIAEMRSPVDAETKSFVLVYFTIVILIFLITGILFALSALKTDNKETNLKGKIILLAVIVYVIGGLVDGVFPYNFVGLFISRILLALSAGMFYSGFVLPNWVKKIFIQENK